MKAEEAKELMSSHKEALDYIYRVIKHDASRNLDSADIKIRRSTYEALEPLNSPNPKMVGLVAILARLEDDGFSCEMNRDGRGSDLEVLTIKWGD